MIHDQDGLELRALWLMLHQQRSRARRAKWATLFVACGLAGAILIGRMLWALRTATN